MTICSEVKMLAVLVVLSFVAGTSDGVILSKCGLKQQIEAAGLTLPQGVLNQTTADFLAKIVCHVNLTSGFNTSAIKQITNPNCSNPQSNPGSNKKNDKHSASSAKGGRGRRSPSNKSRESSSSEGHSGSGENHRDDDMKVWTLYGLFQLSDSVACNSTRGPTLNLCGLSCNKLIDDDISDDLACVQVLINKMTTAISDPQVWRLINKMVSLIYQKECANMVASYLADC